MRLVWEPGALDDLEEVAVSSPRPAALVVRRMETMAAVGWSLGRQTSLDPSIRYVPVIRLGVFYRVRGDELRVVRVVDARRLPQLP